MIVTIETQKKPNPTPELLSEEKAVLTTVVVRYFIIIESDQDFRTHEDGCNAVEEDFWAVVQKSEKTNFYLKLCAIAPTIMMLDLPKSSTESLTIFLS